MTVEGEVEGEAGPGRRTYRQVGLIDSIKKRTDRGMVMHGKRKGVQENVDGSMRTHVYDVS